MISGEVETIGKIRNVCMLGENLALCSTCRDEKFGEDFKGHYKMT